MPLIRRCPVTAATAPTSAFDGRDRPNAGDDRTAQGTIPTEHTPFASTVTALGPGTPHAAHAAVSDRPVLRSSDALYRRVTRNPRWSASNTTRAIAKGERTRAE